MATVEELVERYRTDEAFRKEVEALTADGKLSPGDLLAFAGKYGVKLSLADIPKYMRKARELGFIR